MKKYYDQMMKVDGIWKWNGGYNTYEEPEPLEKFNLKKYIAKKTVEKKDIEPSMNPWEQQYGNF